MTHNLAILRAVEIVRAHRRRLETADQQRAYRTGMAIGPHTWSPYFGRVIKSVKPKPE
jgi:hypothetical protein